ncbi:P-loop containing nucleoside triphosphate hydrolase protein [Mycena sanguinolenta]|nr:P-loop containing nucleoside triphosphate hydrolase protein [Mycena sanguinolenta]
MPREHDHVSRTEESQLILRQARGKARKKTGYDSDATRRDLARLFEQSFKKPPYDWQIDVSEAFLLKLDVVLIAGTGACKTIPFMMPLLLHREKYSLVISPLKVLQEEQAKRFKKIVLKAAAVNGDMYSSDLQKVQSLHPSLDLDLDEMFFLNLGNDRPNITPSVVEMNSAKDYAAVKTHLPNPADVHSPDDLPKTLVSTNAVKKMQILATQLRRDYSHLPKGTIDFLHAHRTVKAKRHVMRDFRKGKIKILVATEAAGMGADISDIELIIQFGVPSSLTVWTQRLGRAVRNPAMQGRAILLYEKSMFKRKKKRKRKGSTVAAVPEPDASDSDSNSDSEDEGNLRPTDADPRAIYCKDFVKEPNDGKEWGKSVDPIMRQYIATKLCRRDMTDHYFNNPPRKGK